MTNQIVILQILLIEVCVTPHLTINKTVQNNRQCIEFMEWC